MSNRTKAIFTLALFTLIIVANLPETKPEAEYFPAPDPSRGVSWGYDFHKHDYRYESSYNGPPLGITNPPAKAHKSKAGIRVNRLSDIKDIHDLDDYLKQNERVVYIQQEITEDEAADILDLTHY